MSRTPLAKRLERHPELTTTDDLKSALHDVLSHGNLFDTAYLSDRFGIELHISHPQRLEGGTTRFEGIATATPPLLYGYIEYVVDVDSVRRTSKARLSFASKSCGLRQWGIEWHVDTHFGMATDGGPTYQWLVWPGSEGIHLQIEAGCSVEMWQTRPGEVMVSVSPDLPQIPPSELSRQIADLLISDLRDYTRVGRVLGTEFEVNSASVNNGLLYEGRPVLTRVMLRFKPYYYYEGNDSGWYMPGSFFARPLHISDRSVTLQLTPDSSVVCLSKAQLASDLKRQGQRIRMQRGDSPDESAYSVHGVNLVSVSVTFEGGCATMLRFSQVTDVAHRLGDPIRFTPADSLDRSRAHLTEEAKRRIHLLALRLRSISVGGIEIDELPGPHPEATVNRDLSLLKDAISKALEQQGVHVLRRLGHAEVGECQARRQPDEPAVCVDAWQSSI